MNPTVENKNGFLITTQVIRESKILVLIVDDDSISRNLLEILLVKHGYIVDKACSGKNALTKFTSAKPDIVLLDIVLPDMSGYEVAKRLRQIDACVELKIIASTGNALHDEKTDFMQAGFDDFLPKPFEKGDLFRILDTFAIEIINTRGRNV